MKTGRPNRTTRAPEQGARLVHRQAFLIFLLCLRSLTVSLNWAFERSNSLLRLIQNFCKLFLR